MVWKSMGPPFKISSISIELEGPAGDIETCEHLNIRGFVAESRDQEIDQRSNSWPLPEGCSANNHGLALPDIRPAPRQRRWTCRNCMRDLDPKDTVVLEVIATSSGDIETGRTNGRDGGLGTVPSTVNENIIDRNSAVIPTQSTLPAVVVLDSENEREATVAGNNVEEVPENLNRDESQQRDHQKDTTARYKLRSRKRPSLEQAESKDQAAVRTTAIADLREDMPPKADPSESVDPSMMWQRSKPRKCREGMMEELIVPSKEIVEEEPVAKKRKSRRGRKRKVVVPENNGIQSTPGEPADNESGSEPIRGKLKNRRFQVADELVPSPEPNDKLVDLAFRLEDDAAAKSLRDLQEDASGTSRKRKTNIFQEQHEASSSRGRDQKEITNVEKEIAEVMARNLYERCLAEKKQPSPEPAPEPKKKGLWIDLNEPLEDINTSELPPPTPSSPSPPPSPSSPPSPPPPPTLPSPPPPSPPPLPPPPQPYDNDARMSSESVQVSHHYMPSPFGIFPSTQEIQARLPMGYPTHSPSPLRVLHGYETYHHSGYPQPQYREMVYPLWPPPMAPHHMTGSYYMNHPTLPQAPCHQNRWNPSLVAAATEQHRPAESSVFAMTQGRLRDPRLTPPISTDYRGNPIYTERILPPSGHDMERLVLQTEESSTPAYPARHSPFIFGSEAFRMNLPIIPAQHQENTHVTYVNNQRSLQRPGTSSSVMLPPRPYRADRETNQEREAEASNNNASALPPCVVNRNPADFSVPEIGNSYMLGREDLVRGSNRRREMQRARDRDTKNKSTRKT